MSDSILLQAVEQAIDELNAETPTGIPDATNRRYIEGEKISEPRIAVFLGDERVEPPRNNAPADPITLRRGALAVQCIALTDDPAELDAVVDPLLQHVVRTLGRSRLDKLVFSLAETGSTRRAYQSDTYVMVLTVLFNMTYQTARDDLTQRTATP